MPRPRNDEVRRKVNRAMQDLDKFNNSPQRASREQQDKLVAIAKTLRDRVTRFLNDASLESANAASLKRAVAAQRDELADRNRSEMAREAVLVNRLRFLQDKLDAGAGDRYTRQPPTDLEVGDDYSLPPPDAGAGVDYSRPRRPTGQRTIAPPGWPRGARATPRATTASW